MQVNLWQLGNRQLDVNKRQSFWIFFRKIQRKAPFSLRFVIVNCFNRKVKFYFDGKGHFREIFPFPCKYHCTVPRNIVDWPKMVLQISFKSFPSIAKFRLDDNSEDLTNIRPTLPLSSIWELNMETNLVNNTELERKWWHTVLLWLEMKTTNVSEMMRSPYFARRASHNFHTFSSLDFYN